MKSLHFSVNRVLEEENATLDTSKLLGAPVFPEDFFEKNNIDVNDYFVAQLNLSEIKDPNGLLPKTGLLYFFLDINSLLPKVIYEPREPETVMDDINDGFDEESCGNTHALYMEFNDEDEPREQLLLGDIDPDLDLGCFLDIDGYVTLLQLDALELPQEHPVLQFTTLSKYDGYYIFLIKESDLRKGDFSKVKFVDYGS